MLVDVAGIHAVPTVELGHGAQMHEPIHLYGLLQVARRMGGHPAADISNLQQLGPTRFVFGLCGHLLGQIGVTLGKEYGSGARDGHSLQLLLLVGGQRVVDIVQRGDSPGDALLEVEQAAAVHFAVHRRVAAGSLLHEFGENTGVIGLFPLLGDVGEDALALGAALPVGNHLALVGADVLLADVVRLQLTRIERVQVFYAVTGELGERRYGFGLGPPLAHDELAIADIDGLLLTDFVEVAGAQDAVGHLAVVFFIECRLDECALDGERGGRVDTLLTQAAYALVHAAFVSGTG